VARTGSIVGRLHRTWRALDRPRRLSAWSALALLATLFLPWYSETVVATSARGVHIDRLQPLTPVSVSGWGAFSWIEAVALLVALGVLALLFRRAEDHAARWPGTDGWAITAGGGFTCAVVIWAMFDKQGVSGAGRFVVSTGLDWGIFVALLSAAALAWAGTRIGADQAPPQPAQGGAPAGAPRPRTPRQRSAWRPADRPDWSDRPEPEPERPPERHPPERHPPERAVGWLGARAPDPPPARSSPPPRPASPPDADQLTIPLEPES
jgi:hypothetical protein